MRFGVASLPFSEFLLFFFSLLLFLFELGDVFGLWSSRHSLLHRTLVEESMELVLAAFGSWEEVLLLLSNLSLNTGGLLGVSSRVDFGLNFSILSLSSSGFGMSMRS
jgi:hypothetical protein